MNWNAVTGADSYNVYYATAADADTRLSQNKVTAVTLTTTTLTTSGPTIAATNGVVNNGSLALQNGTEYFFIVSAVVFVVEGPPTYPVSCVPGVPLATQPFQLRAAGWDNQVILDWHPPTSGADSYNVYYGYTAADATTNSLNRVTGITGPSGQAAATSTPTGTSSGTSSGASTGAVTIVLPATTLTTAGPTITATNGAVNPGSMPLVNRTRYYFIVTAVKFGVEGPPSTPVSTVPNALTSTIPSGVTAVGADRSITISWNPVDNATSYDVYYATSPAGATTRSSNKVTLILPTTVTLTTSGGTISATAGTVNPGSIPLINGIRYYFVVAANLPFGEGAASLPVSTMPGVCAVNQPCSLAAAAWDRQVAVSWTAPASGADTYNLYYATDPSQLGNPPSSSSKVTGLTSTSSVLTTDGTTIISTGAGGTVNVGSVTLDNGTTYFFGVTAVKGGVEGPISVLVSAVPNDLTLTSPWGVSATGGDAKVTVSWYAINGASTYNIYYSTSQLSATTAQGTKIGNVGSPYTVSPLTNGTKYYFVVTAIVNGVESADSTPVVSATPALPTAPSAPISVTAVAGDGLVTVSWGAVTGATSYNVYYATNAGGATTSSGSNVKGITGAGAVVSTIIPGLTNGTTYWFVVTAVNGFLLESAPSSPPVSATPQKAVMPGAPADVSAASGDRTATISWSAVTGATTYNIYWDSTQAGATPASVNKQTGVVGSGYAISVPLPVPANGTSYYFVVTALNNALEGPPSAPVSTLTNPPVFETPIATAVGGAGTIDVSWASVANATSYNVYWSATQAGATTSSRTKQAGITGSEPELFTRITPLTYGSTYYVVVTAVVNGVEGRPQIPFPRSPRPTGRTGSPPSRPTRKFSLVGTPSRGRWNTTSIGPPPRPARLRRRSRKSWASRPTPTRRATR